MAARRLFRHGVIVFAAVLFGFAIGVLGYALAVRSAECTDDLQFINVVLRCNKQQIIGKHGYIVLQQEMEEWIAERMESGAVEHISVYFRDLNNGPIMGINENTRFVPASLLKLPLAIAYYALAEKDEGLFSKQLVYSGEINDAGQHLGPDQTVSENIPYKVSDLIRNMLVYSDNRSYIVLHNYMKTTLSEKEGEDIVLRTYRELGIIGPTDTDDETLTVKEYASLFRLLYNASYLSNASSDALLHMLSLAEYHQGLSGGIPEKMRASHKFGERYGLPGELVQLHDCGIIYYPDNPYLLCVMTRGKDMDRLSEVIREISKMVYSEMESRRL